MLKTVFLNSKKVPVPIPIKSVVELIDWITGQILAKDKIITQLLVDDKEIEIQEGLPLPQISLNASSSVRLRVDSPLDLSVQTLDALRNLTLVLDRKTEGWAVKFWGLEQGQKLDVGAEAFVEDVHLVSEMAEHLVVLLADSLNSTNLNNVCHALQGALIEISDAISQRQWQNLARCLLKSLKPLFAELLVELDGIQRTLFETQVRMRGEIGNTLGRHPSFQESS